MKIYLVGGAVRDKLLNYPYEEKDWVVVGATPEQLLEEGFQQVGKDFPVFLHPNTKEEYALARTERKIAAGYTGFECFSSPDVTLEEDLERRDLTINAIAEDSDGFLTDPYGGQQDLKDKVLRHVSVAFAEDPLRVLRVARFSARYHHLGFTLATETLELMRSISSSDELLALPAERVWKELQRSLIEKSPQQFFITLQEAGALEKLMPELSPLQNKSIEIIKQAAALKNSAPVIFALLMFQCQNDDKDNAKTLCQRLKCPNDFKELALMISNFGKQCHSSKDSADTLLTLLEQLDPFRRPERFELFLQCCELYFNDKQCSSQLRQALSLCSDINIAQLVEEGLSGKEIGQALRQRRLEAIQRGIF